LVKDIYLLILRSSPHTSNLKSVAQIGLKFKRHLNLKVDKVKRGNRKMYNIGKVRIIITSRVGTTKPTTKVFILLSYLRSLEKLASAPIFCSVSPSKKQRLMLSEEQHLLTWCGRHEKLLFFFFALTSPHEFHEIV
jgi:hypothetical protein